MRTLLVSISAAVVLAIPALAQNTGFTFDTPPGWRTVTGGGNTQLLSTDGSRYNVLWSNKIEASPNVLRSGAVKNVAQQLATPLLRSMTFLGAQSVKIDGGSAALFRFEGQPTIGSASHVVVPVWIAVADGGQGVAIVPEGLAPPDHSQEFTELFRSLKFTRTTTATGPKGLRHVTRGMRTVTAIPVVEAERYEGRLYRDDRQFALSLHADGTASAEWKRPNRKTEVLTGNWAGNDGNYLVRLNGASPVVLQLERDGPREMGSMIVDGKKEPIVALNMVSVPVKGTAAQMYGVMFR